MDTPFAGEAIVEAVDMSGAMPRRAWVEIRDASDELLASVPAEIDGGTISLELPAFPSQTIGRVQLCTDTSGRIYREPAELKELPTGPEIMVVMMG